MRIHRDDIYQEATPKTIIADLNKILRDLNYIPMSFTVKYLDEQGAITEDDREFLLLMRSLPTFQLNNIHRLDEINLKTKNWILNNYEVKITSTILHKRGVLS